MKYETFPLTSAEKLHLLAVEEFNKPQVVNIGVCLTLKASLDFGLLKKCIQLEYERCDSLRLRFTKPDPKGEVQQYIVPHEDRDIPFVDFTGESREEIDRAMYSWTEVPFPRWDSPMNEFIMVSLPEGYQGLYLRIDHMLTDSCGVIFMVNDIMELYCHYIFGTPLPGPMLSYKDAVMLDLKKAADPVHSAKDEAFWKEQASLGEPIFTSITGPGKLEESRRRHGSPKLRAADREMTDLSVGQSSFFLEPEPTRRLLDYCMINNTSMTNLFLMGLRTYLSKVNGGESDISVKNYVSRRSSRTSRLSGGTRIHCFPCRTIIEPDTEFLDGVLTIQNLQNSVYRHVNYDSGKALKAYYDAYGTPPKTTYESIALTYQPIPIRLQNDNLKGVAYQSRWFTNGTAIQELYLTVMHNSSDLGLEFYFKYQTAQVSRQDVELLYYYLMKILFMGIENPEMTVGEIMAKV